MLLKDPALEKYSLYFKTFHKDAKFWEMKFFYGLIMNLKEDGNITLKLFETLRHPPPSSVTITTFTLEVLTLRVQYLQCLLPI